MKKPNVKVKFDFIQLPVQAFIDFSQVVLIKMTDNELFEDPDVSLAKMAAALSDLKQQTTFVYNKGRLQVAALQIAHKILLNLMCRQAHYVEVIANGNPDIIRQAGFNVILSTASLTAGDKLVVSHGVEEGQVIVEHKHIDAALAYVWEYAPHPQPVGDKYWIQAGVSRQNEFVINGMKPNIKAWFRAAIVTDDGQQPWCDPVLKDIK